MEGEKLQKTKWEKQTRMEREQNRTWNWSDSPTSAFEVEEIDIIFLDLAASDPDHTFKDESILSNEVNMMDHPKTIMCVNGSEK